MPLMGYLKNKNNLNKRKNEKRKMGTYQRI